MPILTLTAFLGMARGTWDPRAGARGIPPEAPNRQLLVKDTGLNRAPLPEHSGVFMSCEDFPACGHELGCCPDYDEHGNQMNMRCVCGARLSINARYREGARVGSSQLPARGALLFFSFFDARKRSRCGKDVFDSRTGAEKDRRKLVRK